MQVYLHKWQVDSYTSSYMYQLLDLLNTILILERAPLELSKANGDI